ncbi:MAG: methylmalonyl-CoA mutase subunit beta [Flavobacteriaceae bacterium]|nr:methylmalonyl-CoA mutase subunit beta [Flavobacteriaceae bacterium]
MSDFLFKDFKGVSAKEWKQQIQVDLKGADYNETLIWKNIEGIDVKPFYNEEDYDSGFYKNSNPNENWKACQKIFIDDESIANRLTLDAIQRGAEAIYFTSEKEFNIISVFNEVPFSDIKIYINLNFLSEGFYNQLISFLSEKNATVFYNIDIIGNLAKDGNWYKNLNDDHSVLENILKDNSEKNILSIDATLYQNAGANMVQQLAYSLAHANEYLNHFSNKNLQPTLTFKVAVGTNYFFEIAKIRALRNLYTLLAKEYGISEECHIIAFPSKRNKTIYDYNVNLLRTTTEYMSAILGGANSICSLSYDAIYHKSNEFGERIGRNQLLILKSESYFNSENNPTEGSYYIEYLTQQLSEKALNLFKEIESSGGFLKHLKEGKIQRKIKETAEKEQQLFNEGKIVLLGTNKHPNEKDLMKNDLELFPFMKMNPRKTLIEPILENRLSEEIEKERLQNEE